MWEVVAILVVALIFLGPKQLAETARVVGKMYRELQKMMLAESKYDITSGKMENVNVATFLKYQDQSANALIKEIKFKDGTIKPFQQEWLDSLPIEEGNKVYDLVNEITQGSWVKKEEKKN